MLKFKIDVIEELAKRGYTRKVIKETNIFSQSTLTRIKNCENITTDAINKLCLILRLQPGDLLEEVPTDEEKIKYF